MGGDPVELVLRLHPLCLPLAQASENQLRILFGDVVKVVRDGTRHIACRVARKTIQKRQGLREGKGDCLPPWQPRPCPLAYQAAQMIILILGPDLHPCERLVGPMHQIRPDRPFHGEPFGDLCQNIQRQIRRGLQRPQPHQFAQRGKDEITKVIITQRRIQWRWQRIQDRSCHPLGILWQMARQDLGDQGNPLLKLQRGEFGHHLGFKTIRVKPRMRCCKKSRQIAGLFTVEQLILEGKPRCHAPGPYIVELTAPPSRRMFWPTIKPACCEQRKAQVAPNS